MNRVCLAAFLFFAASAASWGQQPDPEIVSYINSIKAIDNHAHVTALDREHDKGYDQLRCDGLPSSNALPPANLRFGPDQQAAYRTLYGFEAKTGDEAELKKVTELETAARREHGADFYAWVLEKAGIETVFANRTAMAPEMKPPQLRWVAYEDALIFPLDNSRQKAVNPDRRVFYGYAEDLLQTYLQDTGMSRIPAALDDYVDKVVRATLQKQKNAGAMAVKFEAAYLRPLDFAPASKDEAARVYGKYAEGGLATPAEYKALQDFLFKQIALEAGKLGLAVHFHTGSGCGDFFDDSGADPMLLSPILNDPDLRKTNIVLLHGNPPRERNVSMLILKPNVYTDMSVLELLWSPVELAHILRPYLEMAPEHVMFGTDAGPFAPGLEWEETTIIGTQHARRALAIGLSEMVRDGTITRDRAKEIANLVLRGNAAKLYRLD
ncbi:MAG: amidohydrolase family protein [Candidatus Acidiferrales bacterium]